MPKEKRTLYKTGLIYAVWQVTHPLCLSWEVVRLTGKVIYASFRRAVIGFSCLPTASCRLSDRILTDVAAGKEKPHAPR